MNNKGFTLIELLAVVLLLGLMTAVAIPAVGNIYNSSKTSSYNTLVKNIKSAINVYLEECKYNDSVDNSVCDAYNANPSRPRIEVKDLLDNGFINSTNKCGGKECITNPITTDDIGDCWIKLEIIDEEKMTFKVESTSSDTFCPQKDEFK